MTKANHGPSENSLQGSVFVHLYMSISEWSLSCISVDELKQIQTVKTHAENHMLIRPRLHIGTSLSHHQLLTNIISSAVSCPGQQLATSHCGLPPLSSTLMVPNSSRRAPLRVPLRVTCHKNRPVPQRFVEKEGKRAEHSVIAEKGCKRVARKDLKFDHGQRLVWN